MSKKKKNYIWLIVLLLIVIVLFIIISKQKINQEKQGSEIQVLEIDKGKKSEGEVTKESLENLMNQLNSGIEVPKE